MRLPVAAMNCHGPTARARLLARFEKPLSIIATKTVSSGRPSSRMMRRKTGTYLYERASHFTKWGRMRGAWKKRT